MIYGLSHLRDSPELVKILLLASSLLRLLLLELAQLLKEFRPVLLILGLELGAIIVHLPR